MSPRHHPSASVLAEYTAGALEPGFGLVVGAHIEACAQCRGEIAVLEAASGAALEALGDAELSGDALARTIARLDEPAPAAAIAETRPLLKRLPLKRRKWIAPGVWVAAVDTPHAADNRVYVLSVAPGRPTAQHTHSGLEFCTVLQGAFRDASGLYGAGDFAMADDAVEHLPVVEGDEACVCLFATEGRLKAKGMLGQLAFAFANV